MNEAFFDIPLPAVTVAPHELSAYVPCYNEALRLPYFLEHHRKLGVTKFFVVDNGSTDGTTDILKAAPDVIWLPSSLPYGTYRQEWRTTICEHYLTDRWVLALDVDELFVYPGWPEVSGPELIAQLDRDGYQCLFTTMVDMYSAVPMGAVSYQTGMPFLDACPYFDATGYRYTPGTIKRAHRAPTPVSSIHGGPRERLFGVPGLKSSWPLKLSACVFTLRRRWETESFMMPLVRLLYSWMKQYYPKVRPRMSKLPLVKWQRGYEYTGGVHELKQTLRMSPMWGALLHFKYFQDFAEKVEQAVIRKQHANGASEYTHYQQTMLQPLQQSPLYEGSKKFVDAQSLIDAGLMRKSDK